MCAAEHDPVECRSDSTFAERPLSLIWEGQRLEIAEILSRWQGPGEKGFRVQTTDKQVFELTYREISGEWIIQPI